MARRLVRTYIALVLGTGTAGSPVSPAAASAATVPVELDAPRPVHSTDAAPLAVRGSAFVDRHGREVTLRGFNVSGTAKLGEHGGLPFASVADAQRSAAAMRRLTGANAIRFLLTWAGTEPTPGRLDTDYLRRATAQLRAFLDEGMYVLVDYHQDLFSRHLFHADSRFTGDGAPRWVVAAGNYPRERCHLCFVWGQNITSNRAIQKAMYDFWHNRELSTSAGPIGVQDAFLRQAEGTLRYIRDNLSEAEFSRVLGLDPLNEPYAGRYDAGQDARTWEQDLLMPFYRKIRDRMDAAGWADKPAFIEPSLLWESNLGFMREPGGFLNLDRLGPRFVFNAHYYDHAAMSGVFLWGKATDGRQIAGFERVRQRAIDLDTAAIVSEFGGPLTGHAASKTPSVLKGMYQALDSGVSGAGWWDDPGRSRSALSGIQWQWDIYNGRHAEPQNGNPAKIQTDGDAWNGEDFSVVRVDDAGAAHLRVDPRMVDRAFPSAVAGTTLAFAYEDRAHDGKKPMIWNRVPTSLPNLAKLVGEGQYAVLVWRSAIAGAPTEVRLPTTFTPADTTVVTDVRGAAVARTDTDRRLVLPTGDAGVVHHALVTNGSRQPSAAILAAARRELARWVKSHEFT